MRSIQLRVDSDPFSAMDLYGKGNKEEITVMPVEIPAAKDIDIYIFEGYNILDIVSRYNMFSGGCDIPQ